MLRLPPLPALRAFEAAARHLSFKTAADELCVTPSSISHQVKKLEDWLGTALFVRFNREVALTQDGSQYLTVVSHALSEISAATATIARRGRAEGERPRLVITANSGLVDCWLSPRLAELDELLPDVDLEVHYGEDLADYRHRDADVAIHYGSVRPPMPNAVFLRRCVEFPVCSPDFRIDGNPLTDVDALSSATLFHERDRLGWTRWLNEAGADAAAAASGPIFQNTLSIFARVEKGDGVALGDDVVAADFLEVGRLVKPFPYVRQSDWSMYLLPLRRDRAGEHVDVFCEWLTETMKGHERETAALRSENR